MKLEGQAAGLAARRLSKTRAVELESAVRACEDYAARLGDAEPDLYFQLNLRFHSCVATAAGNPFLLDVIKTNARKLLAYNVPGIPMPGPLPRQRRNIARLPG